MSNGQIRPLDFGELLDRFLALALDMVYQTLAFLVLLITFALFVPALSRAGGTANAWGTAILIFAAFLIQFGYFAYFESVWQGQTPGKRNQNLRVIKDDGRPITPFDALGRNLLRIVDSLPGLYAIGIASVLISPQNKRLGDYLAGTIVAYDKPLNRGSSLSFRGGDEPVEVVSQAPVHLTADQFQLLEAYTVRKYDLEWDVRQKFARQIMDRLGVPASEEDRANPDAFIERLVKEHRNR